MAFLPLAMNGSDVGMSLQHRTLTGVLACGCSSHRRAAKTSQRAPPCFEPQAPTLRTFWNVVERSNVSAKGRRPLAAQAMRQQASSSRGEERGGVVSDGKPPGLFSAPAANRHWEMPVVHVHTPR